MQSFYKNLMNDFGHIIVYLSGIYGISFILFDLFSNKFNHWILATMCVSAITTILFYYTKFNIFGRHPNWVESQERNNMTETISVDSLVLYLLLIFFALHIFFHES